MIEAEIIKYIITGGLGLIVWFLKRTVDNIETHVSSLKLELDEVKMTYLHKNDFREFKQELKSMFEEIRRDIHVIRDRAPNS